MLDFSWREVYNPFELVCCVYITLLRDIQVATLFFSFSFDSLFISHVEIISIFKFLGNECES